jgi:hypothetical protein
MIERRERIAARMTSFAGEIAPASRAWKQGECHFNNLLSHASGRFSRTKRLTKNAECIPAAIMVWMLPFKAADGCQYFSGWFSAGIKGAFFLLKWEIYAISLGVGDGYEVLAADDVVRVVDFGGSR